MIGGPVATRIVSGNGRLSRDRKRDGGHAAGTAHTTTAGAVAPPHRTRPSSAGVKVLEALAVAGLASRFARVA
ncbi:hypothetical protein [Streptomyces sp. MD20-1-1]|uniref:hypothetical protein n=1 Tax=Streptomyces sp. MD20-1-1 TaxID=3028668 RepID=UPI003FD29621